MLFDKDQQDFENAWFRKTVIPLGKIFDIPIKKYIVTAALYKFENDITIFAIMALDYSLENKHWFTLRIESEKLEESLNDFKIVENE